MQPPDARIIKIAPLLDGDQNRASACAARAQNDWPPTPLRAAISVACARAFHKFAHAAGERRHNDASARAS